MYSLQPFLQRHCLPVLKATCVSEVSSATEAAISDLPFAGYEWGNGFSVRLNRPSQFSVVAKMDWDGKQTIVTVSMWHHTWFMPMFAILTTAFLLWVFLRSEPVARVPFMAAVAYWVAMTTFSLLCIGVKAIV